MVNVNVEKNLNRCDENRATYTVSHTLHLSTTQSASSKEAWSWWYVALVVRKKGEVYTLTKMIKATTAESGQVDAPRRIKRPNLMTPHHPGQVIVLRLVFRSYSQLCWNLIIRPLPMRPRNQPQTKTSDLAVVDPTARSITRYSEWVSLCLDNGCGTTTTAI